MRRRSQIIINTEFKPIMRNFCKGSRDRRISRIFHFLADLHEFIPCGIRCRNVHARRFADRFIHEQAFPVAIHRNGIVFPVRRGSPHHAVLHVRRIVRIYFAYFFNGNYLSCLYERIGVHAVKVEKHIRLRTHFKIGNNSCLKSLRR